MTRIASLLLIVMLVGCGGQAAPTDAPSEEIRALESRLLSAENISFDFRVISEGVIEGGFTGQASISSSGAVTIDAQGRFIERDLVMQMRTDTDSLRLTTNEMSDVLARPEHTFEAMVIGLTRMGLMHNLAALSTVSPPDHSDGGASEWVYLDNFGRGQAGEYEGISFDIFVDSSRTSGAVLALEDGVPVFREQRVDFPGGQMIVQEEYSNFTIVPQD